ncbi:hypothetical protein Mro03_21710 [Microbispora rosea subsp. rosea]|nr:hypothetical protein Mro03_21710 [Microbispora rosea subsp. rosea]
MLRDTRDAVIGAGAAQGVHAGVIGEGLTAEVDGLAFHIDSGDPRGPDLYAGARVEVAQRIFPSSK